MGTGEDDAIIIAVEQFRRLKTYGFSTIVDLTVFGLGRNVTQVARVARAAGINIIVREPAHISGRDFPLYFKSRLATSRSDVPRGPVRARDRRRDRRFLGYVQRC